MGLRAFLSRITARVFGRSQEDWSGEPGQSFRRDMKEGASSSYQARERARWLKEMGWKRLEGEGREKLDKALLNEAQAEKLRIEAEEQRRLLKNKEKVAELQVKVLEVDIQNKIEDARLKRIEGFRKLRAELDSMGVVYTVDEELNFNFLREGDPPGQLLGLEQDPDDPDDGNPADEDLDS